MKIISVDNEKMAVDYMEHLLRQVEPTASFAGFTRVDNALSYLSRQQADIAFLDIEMGQHSGLALAKQCKELCPQINIIFVTGYSEYALDAHRLHASGYLMKPVRADDLRFELASLRHPVPAAPIARVRVQTFGNFEVFVDDKPLKLPLNKCRECLAYLVDRRGARVTVRELADILFEDKPFSHTLRNNIYQILYALLKALKELGIADIIIKYPREIAIVPAKIDCDYYRMLSGDVQQLNLFTGEYMKNYSWAELTVGALTKPQ